MIVPTSTIRLDVAKLTRIHGLGGIDIRGFGSQARSYSNLSLPPAHEPAYMHSSPSAGRPLSIEQPAFAQYSTSLSLFSIWICATACGHVLANRIEP